MVTRGALRKYILMSTEIAKETEVEPEAVEKVLLQVEKRIEQNRRQPKPPAPEGGISLREAAKKYRLSYTTLWRRAKAGIDTGEIKVLSKTKNWLYIDEKDLVEYLGNDSRKED